MSFLKSGQPIQTTGKNLTGLWRPSFVKTDKRLFVFGGGGTVTHDLHVLHFDDMRWESIQALEGAPPSKRYGHTATKWNNSFIIFGGCNEHQDYCNDIHIFNLDTLTWTQPNITGSVSARYLHTAAVYNNKLYIYGGFAKSSDCTYVLEEMNILDLNTMTWSQQHEVPPRYNHSATLVGSKMYIYGGKNEQGNTVSDLFVINLQTTSPLYPCHLVLKGTQNNQMALLKSQHFCDAVCGKLFVFGRFLIKHNPLLSQQQQQQQLNEHAGYSLWMLDLDTLEWKRQDCNKHFEVGGWNYFTIIQEIQPTMSAAIDDYQQQQQVSLDQSQVVTHHLLFLGNTDIARTQGYDHFRDALVINGESLGVFDISPCQYMSEFGQMLDNPEFSDFTIVPSTGQPIYVHQVILMTRWPHFRNVYKSGMIESSERRIDIPEPREVVMAFLKYLYSDQLDDQESWTVICELLVVANMYLQHRLKKLCCQRLYQHHLTLESCAIIYEKAILSDEMGLKLLTLDFMYQHFGSVLKSNVLFQVSPSIQQAFFDSVPEEATLFTGRSKYITHHHHQNNNNIGHYPSASSSTSTLASDLTMSTSATILPQQYSQRMISLHHHHQLQQQQQSTSMDTDESDHSVSSVSSSPNYMTSSTSASSLLNHTSISHQQQRMGILGLHRNILSNNSTSNNNESNNHSDMSVEV